MMIDRIHGHILCRLLQSRRGEIKGHGGVKGILRLSLDGMSRGL